MFRPEQFTPGTRFRGDGINDNGACVVVAQTDVDGYVGPDWVWAYKEGNYNPRGSFIYRLDEIVEILPGKTLPSDNVTKTQRDRVIEVLKRIDDGIYASLDDRADAIFDAIFEAINDQG